MRRSLATALDTTGPHDLDDDGPSGQELLLEEVLALEERATQYEDLGEASRAVAALGRLGEQIPADQRAHVVTTCLFLASERKEDAWRPALRKRRESARSALRSLRGLAPKELVWEVDELLATGQWNLAKRFPSEVRG